MTKVLKVVEVEEAVRTPYRVNGWEVTNEKSEFFGKHDSGTVNIPEGEFTPEELAGWIEEGKLIPKE